MSCLDPISNFLQHHKWAVLVAWQVDSVFLCGIGTLVSFLAANYEKSLPNLMVGIGYLLLILTSCWKQVKTDMPWRWFLLVSLLLFVGDYTAIQAYNHTSLSSALMFLTTVILWVAPISYFVFGRKYTWKQVLSFFIALGGIALIFVADGTAGNKWLGNIYALVSALCYAIGTVVQEALVHNESVMLYVFRFSCGAFPCALILCCATEWKDIRDYNWTWQSISMILAYSIILAFLNYLAPYVMQFSTATTCNLSLLTTNFFSLFVSIWLFNMKSSWVYYVGFVCIPIAIVLFNLGGDPNGERNDEYDNIRCCKKGNDPVIISDKDEGHETEIIEKKKFVHRNSDSGQFGIENEPLESEEMRQVENI